MLDLARNIIRRLSGALDSDLLSVPEHSVLVVERLLPSDVVRLPKANVRAVVVESVRLIEQNELSVISRWLGFIEHLKRHVLPERSGRLVKSMGDGLLLDFTDVRSAASVALAIQHESRRANLDYPPELANVPDSAVESFAGVANPFSLGRLERGERVLDLGSGAGTDSLVAAQMVGREGRVTGIDMTPAMLAKARGAAAEMGATNVDFVEGEVEQLPCPDGSFDVVISNGVIDLIPDKDAMFSEIERVLVPGGRIQIADVTIQNPVSAEGRRNIDLWTG